MSLPGEDSGLLVTSWPKVAHTVWPYFNFPASVSLFLPRWNFSSFSPSGIIPEERHNTWETLLQRQVTLGHASVLMWMVRAKREIQYARERHINVPVKYASRQEGWNRTFRNWDAWRQPGKFQVCRSKMKDQTCFHKKKKKKNTGDSGAQPGLRARRRYTKGYSSLLQHPRSSSAQFNLSFFCP